MGKKLEGFINKAKELGIYNNIVFLGNIDNVNDYLSASDIFVIPSTHEGYPFALIEAQCSGLPCIVSDRITPEAMNNKLCKIASINKSDIWVDAINSIGKVDRKNNSILAAGWLINKNNSNIKIEKIYDEF